MGPEVHVRDGEAATLALGPAALGVAERWHLMENASAAFLTAVQRSMRAIRKAVGVPVWRMLPKGRLAEGE